MAALVSATAATWWCAGRAVAPLLAQKKAISNADSISELDSWVESGDPCDGWSGVTCDQSGNVISLWAAALRSPAHTPGQVLQRAAAVESLCFAGTLAVRGAW